MAHGQGWTVVHFIKYLRKLRAITGKALGGGAHRHTPEDSVGHTPGHWASCLQTGVLLYFFWALHVIISWPTASHSGCQLSLLPRSVCRNPSLFRFTAADLLWAEKPDHQTG